MILNNVIFGPLVIAGRAEGLIGLANKPTEFTENDARLIMALSNLVAIGLNRTKIEDELRESQTKLSESIDELQLYASLLRHDLSNDLQLILGELELAQMNVSNDPRIIGYLTSIESASSRMLRLLQVFQDTVQNEIDNLLELIQHLVNETKTSYPHITINAHYDLIEEMVSIRGRSLIPFVFDNLIRNSVQHVGPNVEIDIYIAVDAEKAVIDFVDNGAGIDDKIAAKLFQKGVSKTGGGFGLYLCRKIIATYDGTINLLSNDEYKKGTAIRIKLPRIHSEVKQRGHTGY